MVFGYAEYEGGWVRDLRHGKGRLRIFTRIDNVSEEYTYIGEFVEGRRHGPAKVFKGIVSLEAARIRPNPPVRPNPAELRLGMAVRIRPTSDWGRPPESDRKTHLFDCK